VQTLANLAADTEHWTNSGVVVVQSVTVLEESEDLREQVATPLIEVEGKQVSLSCETPDAHMYLPFYRQIQRLI
jgi:IS4 transposase